MVKNSEQYFYFHKKQRTGRLTWLVASERALALPSIWFFLDCKADNSFLNSWSYSINIWLAYKFRHSLSFYIKMRFGQSACLFAPAKTPSCISKFKICYLQHCTAVVWSAQPHRGWSQSGSRWSYHQRILGIFRSREGRIGSHRHCPGIWKFSFLSEFLVTATYWLGVYFI